MTRQRKKGLRQMANEAAKKIEVAGQATIEAVHECGQILIEAKRNIPHGEFLGWIEKEFVHGERQARRYMAIGKLELIDVMNCNTIHEALKINSPQKAANPETKSATKSDLKPTRTPSESTKPAEPADDFADLEPAKAVTKREAVTIDQDNQKTLLREWVSAFADIENKLTAAKGIVELLALHDLKLLALVVEAAIETKSKGVAA